MFPFVFNFYSSHKTWIDYLPTFISVCISLVSVFIASMALYFTRFKRGKPEIHLYMQADEYSMGIGSRHSDIPICFSITIPLVVKNLGANAIALGEIKWKLEQRGIIKGEIFRTPDIGDIKNSICPLSPYQQLVESLSMSFQIEGYGEGFKYQDLIPDLASHLKNSEIKLQLQYTSYEKKRLKHYS